MRFYFRDLNPEPETQEHHPGESTVCFLRFCVLYKGIKKSYINLSQN